MGGARRVEELRVWVAAKALLDDLTPFLDRDGLRRDLDLRSQINAAACSVMANVAEGFGRGRRREFGQFCRVAAGSAAELRSHLHVALSRRYLTATEVEPLLDKCAHVQNMLKRLIHYLTADPPTAGRQPNRTAEPPNNEQPNR